MATLDALRPYRPLLWLTAAVGGLGVNGLFFYAALVRPETIAAAFGNPLALAFIGEAVLLTVLAAWLIARSDVRRPGWIAFVAMSLAGSLAFSIPAFLLWHVHRRGGREAA
ncbi:hypothetical protein [Rubrivirga sp. IMCC43871]|uniref:hypothetical protein n=1 Tax=Rubrivirga sp. IMCC43871 TaxID=3391575 RepID=UPI00399010D8